MNLKIIERAFTFRLWEELKTALNESEFSQSEEVSVKALAPFQQLPRKQRGKGTWAHGSDRRKLGRGCDPQSGGLLGAGKCVTNNRLEVERCVCVPGGDFPEVFNSEVCGSSFMVPSV